MGNIKYVYLRFTKTKSFAGWLISVWTGGWPSHVEFVTKYGEYLGSDMNTGVARVTDEYYKDYKLTQIEFYKIQVTTEQYDKVYEIAEAQLGKKYDTWALIGNVLRRNWQYTEKWFCSELCSYCLKKVGKPLLNYKTNRITPFDLLKSPLLIRCYDEDVRENL